MGTWADTWADVRRSFADFPAVPLLVVVGFIASAAAVYVLDRHNVSWLEGLNVVLAVSASRRARV